MIVESVVGRWVNCWSLGQLLVIELVVDRFVSLLVVGLAHKISMPKIVLFSSLSCVIKKLPFFVIRQGFMNTNS